MSGITSKHKIALVVGTRPEVIKMAPVYFALQRQASIQPVLISTGQHRQMLDQAFAVFGLKPDIDLGLMQPGQTLPDLTGRVLTAMTQVLKQERPAAVLVQGDTTTVLGTALAAFYERVPIGHVEAGLRTYDFEAPWPEEMNRRLADPISRWCFAPTEWSAANLVGERIPQQHVSVTGNTVVDALLWVREKLRREQRSVDEVAARCGIPGEFAGTFLGDAVAPRSSLSGERDSLLGTRYSLSDTGYPEQRVTSNEQRVTSNEQPVTSNEQRVTSTEHPVTNNAPRFILITGHRRESFGGGFENICQAIARIAEKYPDVGLLYPVHLNPNVQEPVRRILGANPRVALIPPVGYEDFIWLMDRCHFVLSDSGGVQEEAPSLGKPVLVMRTTTERPEGVDAGTCRLVGTDPDVIVREASLLLDDAGAYEIRSRLKNPYGDGTASERIAAILARDLCGEGGGR